MSKKWIQKLEDGDFMPIFNNVTNKVRDNLIKTIREGSQVSGNAAEKHGEGASEFAAGKASNKAATAFKFHHHQ